MSVNAPVCAHVNVCACVCPGLMDSTGGGRDARWPVDPGSEWELVTGLGQCGQSPKPWVGGTEQERVSTWAPLRACRGAGTGVSQKDVSPRSCGHGTAGVGMQPGLSTALPTQHRLGTAAGAKSTTLLAGLGAPGPEQGGEGRTNTLSGGGDLLYCLSLLQCVAGLPHLLECKLPEARDLGSFIAEPPVTTEIPVHSTYGVNE